MGDGPVFTSFPFVLRLLEVGRPVLEPAPCSHGRQRRGCVRRRCTHACLASSGLCLCRRLQVITSIVAFAPVVDYKGGSKINYIM